MTTERSPNVHAMRGLFTSLCCQVLTSTFYCSVANQFHAIFFNYTIKELKCKSICMRFIILILLFSVNAYSQDCETLNKFKSYHGLKFGNKFPDSLKQYFIKDTLKEGTYKYTMWTHMTSFKEYQKFKTWFYMGYDFGFIDFSCLKDETIYRVILREKFKYDKPSPITFKKYPKFIKDIIQELSATFGEPAIADDVMKDEDGTTSFGFYWDCGQEKNISLFFSCPSMEGNCVIMISDAALLKKAVLQKYTD